MASEDRHPMQQVALLFVEAAATALTPIKLKEAIGLLESIDPEERADAGDGMAQDVLNILVRERAAR